jgi:hypothetical protein
MPKRRIIFGVTDAGNRDISVAAKSENKLIKAKVSMYIDI